MSSDKLELEAGLANILTILKRISTVNDIESIATELSEYLAMFAYGATLVQSVLSVETKEERLAMIPEIEQAFKEIVKKARSKDVTELEGLPLMRGPKGDA